MSNKSNRGFESDALYLPPARAGYGPPRLRNVAFWPIASFRCAAEFGRFSNRPVWVKHFQTIHHCSVDVARGLVLLFGIGA